MLDAPPHHVFFVDRPAKHRSPGSFRVAEKFGSPGTHQGFLQDVEGYVRNREKLPRVGDGEANVADWE